MRENKPKFNEIQNIFRAQKYTQMSANGIQIRVFGPVIWSALHIIAQNYPLNPSPTRKKRYEQFFRALGCVLPCGSCRRAYHGHVNTGRLKLDGAVLRSRATLTKWLYDFHAHVNKSSKYSVSRTPSFESVLKRYERFRSGPGRAKWGSRVVYFRLGRRKIHPFFESRRKTPVI